MSENLERWLVRVGPKTLGGLEEVFAEKTFAVTIMFLMFVPALPLPTGGVTHVFEAMTVVVAGEMVLGLRTIWLPTRWRQRQLGTTTIKRAIPFMVRRIRWFERFSRPRWAPLFRRRWFLRLLGLIVIAFALAAGLAPPFSGLDTLPALGAVVVALSVVLEDAVLLGVGIVIGAAGTAVMLTLGAAVVHLIGRLF